MLLRLEGVCVCPRGASPDGGLGQVLLHGAWEVAREWWDEDVENSLQQLLRAARDLGPGGVSWEITG